MTTATTVTTGLPFSDVELEEARHAGHFIEVHSPRSHSRIVSFDPVPHENVVAEKFTHVQEPFNPDIIQNEHVLIKEPMKPDEIEHEHVTVHKALPPRVIKRTHYTYQPSPPTRRVKKTFVHMAPPVVQPVASTKVILQPFEYEGVNYHLPLTGTVRNISGHVDAWALSHPEHAHLVTPMLQSFAVVEPTEHVDLYESPHNKDIYFEGEGEHIHNFYD